jgi:hypothetical protein
MLNAVYRMWSSGMLRRVAPVEDAILHSHRRENLNLMCCIQVINNNLTREQSICYDILSVTTCHKHEPPMFTRVSKTAFSPGCIYWFSITQD